MSKAVAVQNSEQTQEATASSDAREPPTMRSSCLTWQNQGFVWRDAFVRLPMGMLLQDLQDVPAIWKQIQSVPQTALRRFDRVTAVAFTEEWMVRDCVVVDADSTRVVLAIRPGDRITLSQKSGQWEDDRHVIRWAGSGFGIFRKGDGVQVMPNTYGTIDAAKAGMYSQFYTQRAS